MNGYDIIGDIHGYGDVLRALLEKLGYSEQQGAYRHPTRQVVFLGDFIDRGPQQQEVLEIVMTMISSGAAKSVMGNHEFNALSFHTLIPGHTDRWLRKRTNKNLQQHMRFLEHYLKPGAQKDLDEVLGFFASLPLWLELDGLRVVHACWEPNYIEQIRPLLSETLCLTPDFLIDANDPSTLAYDAVEALLKGVEYVLPEGAYFHDKDGHRRTAVRTQWWKNRDGNVSDIALPKGIVQEPTASHPISAVDLVGYPEDAPPVFIGHYWFEGHPVQLSSNVACLDYSVAKSGKLVAYRWSGESKLRDDHFVYISSLGAKDRNE